MGQEPGNPVTSIRFCGHCLPATRAQSNAGPDSPFRLTHRGGCSNQGPTTSAPRRERTSNVLIEPSHQLEGSPIHRTGCARKRPRQVISELGTTTGKRLEEGAGRVEALSTGQHRPRSCEGRQGSAAVGGGSGTSDGSCCAPVPVSHHSSSLLTWLTAARRYESDSEVVNQWDTFVSTYL